MQAPTRREKTNGKAKLESLCALSIDSIGLATNCKDLQTGGAIDAWAGLALEPEGGRIAVSNALIIGWPPRLKTAKAIGSVFVPYLSRGGAQWPPQGRGSRAGIDGDRPVPGGRHHAAILTRSPGRQGD